MHDRDVERAEPGQRVAVSLPGVERARGRPGRGARRGRRVPVVVPSRRRARRARADRGRRAPAGAPRDDARRRRASCGSASGSRSSGSRRPSSRRAATASSSAARRRSAAERSSIPRRRDTATRLGVRCSRAGTSRRRSRRPSGSNRCASSLDGELAGVERAGPWAFSAAWLAAYEAELRGRIAAADPIDPGSPTARRAVGRRRPPAPPVRAARREALPPGRGRDARRPEAEADGARGRARVAPACARRRSSDDELARFLEASGRLVRLGDGYAIGADAFEVAKDVLLTECRAERRDHTRALPRPRRNGPPRRAAPARAVRRRRADASAG